MLHSVLTQFELHADKGGELALFWAGLLRDLDRERARRREEIRELERLFFGK